MGSGGHLVEHVHRYLELPDLQQRVGPKLVLHAGLLAGLHHRIHPLRPDPTRSLPMPFPPHLLAITTASTHARRSVGSQIAGQMPTLLHILGTGSPAEASRHAAGGLHQRGEVLDPQVPLCRGMKRAGDVSHVVRLFAPVAEAHHDIHLSAVQRLASPSLGLLPLQVGLRRPRSVQRHSGRPPHESSLGDALDARPPNGGTHAWHAA